MRMLRALSCAHKKLPRIRDAAAYNNDAMDTDRDVFLSLEQDSHLAGVSDRVARIKSMTLAIHSALDEQQEQLDELHTGVQDSHAQVQSVEARTQEVGNKSSRMCGSCSVM